MTTEIRNRFSVTLDWASQLAALGLRDQEIRIWVEPQEWNQWRAEEATMRRYTVEPMGVLDLQFYGPSGLRVRVTAAEPQPRPRYCQTDRCIKPFGHAGSHEGS